MDKEDVVRIYNGILLSHKRNKIRPFVETWMNPETVIQSEVSHKEKNKYHILTHICGIQKNGIDDPICKAEIETQTFKGMDTKGEGEWDELGDWD